MRPSRPAVSTREELRERVQTDADRIEARVGYYLAALEGGERFEVVAARDPDRPYTAASVIKLPVLAALYRKHDAELAALDERRPVAPENEVGGSGVVHLFDDVEPSLRDLARAMIAVSDNAATNELIDYVGVDAVNDTAAALGMKNTRLGRKMMATLEDSPGAVSDSHGHSEAGTGRNTTAPLDCARFYRRLLAGDAFSDRATGEMLEALGHQNDRSMVARYAPSETDLAHKTGWLPDAALDAGVVESADHRPYVFAVFVDEADHAGDATDVVAEIGDATLEWIRQAER